MGRLEEEWAWAEMALRQRQRQWQALELGDHEVEGTEDGEDGEVSKGREDATRQVSSPPQHRDSPPQQHPSNTLS